MEQGLITDLVCSNQVLGTRADPTSVMGKVGKSLLPQATFWQFWKFLRAELLKLVAIEGPQD